MSEQELTEAVRIVREIVRPLAWARERWSGHGWVRDTEPADALDAVLAALHQARDVAGGAQQRVLDLEADLSEYRIGVDWLHKRVAALEAERGALERARLRSADWLTLGKLEAGIYAHPGLSLSENVVELHERLTEARAALMDALHDHALTYDAAGDLDYLSRAVEAEAALRWCDEFAPGIVEQAHAVLRDTAPREERCPYCAKPIGAGDAKTCNAGCHGKGDSCRCEPPRKGESWETLCLCGAASPGEWTAGVHHGTHRCARVITGGIRAKDEPRSA